jgi:Heavy metal binding domain
MKNIINMSFVLALSVLAFSACKNTPKMTEAEKTAAVAAGTKFICPMNCEKGKTYDAPGSCPVCHMDLEPMKAEVEANKSEYFTNYSSNPAQLEAGKAGMMSFTPKIKGNESAIVPLDLVHQKKMHLILVSDDLSWFEHIHPEFQASGNYDIKVLAKNEAFVNGRGHSETRFENGGKFIAFTDYKPTGGLNQVNQTVIDVAGTPAKPVAFSAEKLSTKVDGFTVTMKAAHGATGFLSGSQQHVDATVTNNGKPVDPATFENYLGEKAHLIMVEVGSKAFVHTHPSVADGKFDIHTTFEKPGTYRGWLQFQTDGKLHTADFVIKVAEGQATTGGDGHGAGDGHNGH